MNKIEPIQSQLRTEEMQVLEARIYSLININSGISQLLDLFKTVEERRSSVGSIWCFNDFSKLVFDPQRMPRYSLNELKNIMHEFLNGDHNYAKDLSVAITQLQKERFREKQKYRSEFDHMLLDLANLELDPRQRRTCSAETYLRFEQLFLRRDLEITPYVADFVCIPKKDQTKTLETTLESRATKRYLPQILITFETQKVDRGALIPVAVNFDSYLPQTAPFTRDPPRITHYLDQQLEISECGENSRKLVVLSERRKDFQPLHVKPALVVESHYNLRVK